MSHNHNHEHCKHEHLQYCNECKVVHCLDCQQEWPEKEIITIEKPVYKDWTKSWPEPRVTWQGSSPIEAISNKTVWDADRFDKHNHF